MSYPNLMKWLQTFDLPFFSLKSSLNFTKQELLDKVLTSLASSKCYKNPSLIIVAEPIMLR